MSKEDSKKINLDRDYSCHISAVKMRKNKLNKKHLILDYKKKLIKVKIYPTFTFTTNSDTIKSINRKLNKLPNFKKKKILIEIAEYRYERYQNIMKRKQKVMESMTTSMVNFYSIDKDLNKCIFSFGNFVELNYKDRKKILIITTSPCLNNENFDSYYFYFSLKPIDESGGFIKFFEAIGRSHNIDQKLDLLLTGKSKFELINVGLSNIFKELILTQDNIVNDILLFDIPTIFYSSINHLLIPKINLSDEKKLQKEIIFMSVSLDYQQTETESRIDQLICREYFNYNTININFGEINKNKNRNDIDSFKSSCIYGGVGSLLFNMNNFKEPIGINIGSNYRENQFLSFQNFKFNNFLKSYLQLEHELLC